ncbi:MAG: hypothetical protein AB7P07_08850 [Hyphomonadaceae bacterium]
MLTDMIAKVERVLAALTALLLFTLNEVRMYHMLPRTAQPAEGQVHATSVHVFGGAEQVYLSLLDLSARWGLVAMTVALCAWALADTLRRPKPA